jgi:hypothetical protein
MEFAHLTAEQLVDYFEGKWLPEQEVAIEIHFANCAICAEAAHRVFDVGAIYNRWTNKKAI